MKKTNDNYFVVNLGKFTTPEIVEVQNKEWIEYGADNNFFQYLIDRFTGSTTNNAIINGIANQIYGKGISARDAQRRPEQFAQMLSLFKKEDLKRFIKDRKLLGMAAFQISYLKGGIAEVSHFPINTLRSGKKNKDGDIEKWFYHPNWIKKKASETPKAINSFGFGNKKGNEMLVLQPYVAGFEHYSPVDYVGALPYALLEEEIADYLINDTINGFSGTKVINFNNGVPDEKKRLEIKKDVIGKLTGARGEKVIIAFNNNKESGTTVEDLPLNDAPAHYEYLSKESRDKLIVAHKVTSPMLIGVRETGGGLGNNADEIKTASLLFDSITIDFFRNEVTDVMDKILAVNDISLKLFFKTLQPLELTSVVETGKESAKPVVSAETLSAQAGLRGSVGGVQGILGIQGSVAEGKTSFDSAVSMLVEIYGFSEETSKELLGIKTKIISQEVGLPTETNLSITDDLINIGVDNLGDDWILIDDRDVDYENEEFLDKELEELNKKKQSTLSKTWNFVKTGIARPNSKSKQDKTIKEVIFTPTEQKEFDDVMFKVRYQYNPLRTSTESRAFCIKMVQAKKLYRKEDIVRMSSSSVNAGWGPGGANNYDIFKYKGGGGCHHRWRRKTFMSKKKINLKSPSAPTIGTRAAEIRGYTVRNPIEVSVRPVDMPNKGFIKKR